MEKQDKPRGTVLLAGEDHMISQRVKYFANRRYRTMRLGIRDIQNGETPGDYQVALVDGLYEHEGGRKITPEDFREVIIKLGEINPESPIVVLTFKSDLTKEDLGLHAERGDKVIDKYHHQSFEIANTVEELIQARRQS